MGDTKIPLGHIKNTKVNLKGVMENMDVDVNKMTLYCGKNGTGKTMIMIFQWIMATMANMWVGSAKSDMDYTKFAQELMDGSFEKNDFNGEVSCEFDNLDISWKLTDGKVSDFNVNIGDPSVGIEPGRLPIFMSKNTRLFDDVHKYMKLKRSFNMKGTGLNDEECKKLLEFYRIYDIFFMEMMLHNLRDPNWSISPGAIKSFSDVLEKDIIKVSLDDTECNIKVHEMRNGTEEIYSAGLLSAGEQSWVNMFINS